MKTTINQHAFSIRIEHDMELAYQPISVYLVRGKHVWEFHGNNLNSLLEKVNKQIVELEREFS